MPQQDAATIREWTDILGRCRFGALDKTRRRGRSAAVIKAVAVWMAKYGDFDGTRIRPGLVRLSVELEMHYETVADAVAVLASIGLLRLIRAASRPREANEYQLAIPQSLVEDVEVWSPTQFQAVLHREGDRRKGTYREPTARRKQDLPRSTTQAAAPVAPEPAPVLDPGSPVDNPDLPRSSTGAADPDPPTPAPVLDPRRRPPAPVIVRHLPRSSTPPTYQRPIHQPDQPPDDRTLRPDLALVGARGRDNDFHPRLAEPPLPAPVLATIGRPAPGDPVAPDPPEVLIERARRGRALVDQVLAAKARGEPIALPDPTPGELDRLAVVIPLRRPA